MATVLTVDDSPSIRQMIKVTLEPAGHSVIEAGDGALLLVTSEKIRQLRDGKVESYRLPWMPRRFKPTSLLRDRDGALSNRAGYDQGAA